MKSSTITKRWIRFIVVIAFISGLSVVLMSSSHREAPLIANDPLADNTDLYAFRSPDYPDKITIIANYIPAELPFGGPNYYTFGDDIRYEIHVKNNIKTPGDDIIYRFTFKQENEDPTTFFNIRLGKQNLKTTYRCEKSSNGGNSFYPIITKGEVPPNNIGPRSIGSAVGLNTPDYNTLINQSIAYASTGEKVFCGPADDPFFVDLGGVFDLGDIPRQNAQSRDGLGHYNVHSICLQVDISALQKDHKPVSRAVNILDPDFVIGVWASASRKKISTLKSPDEQTDRYNDNYVHASSDRNDDNDNNWVQVSRLGMPLTNEVVVPIGKKDYWNTLTPYEDLDNIKTFGNSFYNPELALYMDNTFYGGAIPALSSLRVQRNSLGAYGFGNNQNGLYGLKGNPALAGSALDDKVFGKLLLPA